LWKKTLLLTFYQSNQTDTGEHISQTILNTFKKLTARNWLSIRSRLHQSNAQFHL